MALIFVVTLMLALSCECFGNHIYKVGDSAGWTLNGVNYEQWASGKIFRVGDTLVFTYHKKMHNVLHVSKKAFESCNTSSHVAAYSSGYDKVPIDTPGDMNFICGIPGHCQAGMKVVITVTPPTPYDPPTSLNSPPTTPNAAPAPSSGPLNLPNAPSNLPNAPMFPNKPNNTMPPYSNPNANGNPSSGSAPALYSSKLAVVTVVAFGVMGFTYV